MKNRSKKFFNKQEEQKLMMEALKVRMEFLADKEKMAKMKEAYYNKMKKRLKEK